MSADDAGGVGDETAGDGVRAVDDTASFAAELATLRPEAGDRNRYERVGEAVAVDGDAALVGTGAGGVVYAFERSAGGWTLAARLTPGDDRGGRFGVSVSLDGDAAVVGAPVADDPNGDRAGAAYAFERSGGEWTRAGRLAPADGDPDDRFGRAVAVCGDVAVVGAPLDEDPNGEGAGSASVFERSGGTWREVATLSAADGDPDDRFGRAVATDGDVAVVGAPFAGDRAGAAYAFDRSGDDWVQAARLTAAEGGVGDSFGVSVAVDGETVVVGADLARSSDGVVAGAAYAFDRSGGAWTRSATLWAENPRPGDFFGTSVALAGDAALVGAPLEAGVDGMEAGAAYVFERSGGGWTRTRRLSADGARGDRFGDAVALAGGAAVVGRLNASPETAGGAHAFERSGEDWTRVVELSGPLDDPGDRFGAAVAVDGDLAVVGARGDEDPNGPEAGAAYAFERSDGVWTHGGQLAASDGVSYDGFGHAVAVEGDAAVVGAPFDDSPERSPAGAAYAFERSGGEWVQRSKLTVPGGDPGDALGASVVTSDDVVLVGAPGASAVHVFERSGENWTRAAGLSGDGRFGTAVAVQDDVAVVGAPGAGTAHVFERSGGNWTRIARLTGEGGSGDRFGAAVALDGGAALVGDPGAGAVFVFERSGGDWSRAARLDPGDGAAGFGSAVDLGGDVAVVGDPSVDGPDGEDAGTATVFERSDGAWSRLERLAADPGPGDALGIAVGVDDGTVLVGAPGDGSGAVPAARGSVSVFGGLACDAPPPVVSADLNGDCAIDSDELRTAIAAWARGEYTTEELRAVTRAWATD